MSNVKEEMSSKTLVAVLKEKRHQQKETLIKLNAKFSKYMDRVRLLESQNKQLICDLVELKKNWCDKTREIRVKYEPDLDSARSLLNKECQLKLNCELRIKESQDEIEITKSQLSDEIAHVKKSMAKIFQLNVILDENQMELEMLRNKIYDLEEDVVKYKKEVDCLNYELQSLMKKLSNEISERVEIENEKQTLEESILFLNAMHDLEMNELKKVECNFNPEFYRVELKKAIRDIRQDFNESNEEQRRDLEAWYAFKVDEAKWKYARSESSILAAVTQEQLTCLRSENEKNQSDLEKLRIVFDEGLAKLRQLEESLRNLRERNRGVLEMKEKELGLLREKFDETLAEYDELMSDRDSLEFEICTYRRLLESEENRGLRNRIEAHVFARREEESDEERQVQTTLHRSAKGPVSISECSSDGKVITIENTSRNRDVAMGGWTLLRRVDSRKDIVYEFQHDLVLKAARTMRLHSNCGVKENLPFDVVNREVDNWGKGVSVETFLFNEAGVEKARFSQKSF